ncbi:protein DJ-1 [Citrus sinensis]|uniref:Protein DJ-1 n=2 Tax=Citrus sinensis TaxID=2711 RepID=A0ACB8LZB7_CITSI|nr:protein DJ-1 [Citrus sinensis]
MVLISVRHVTPHSLLRHFPLTQHFLPKQIPSLKNRIFSFTATATMSSTSKKVLVPVANGSEPIEAVITIDVLRRSGADVTVASVDKQLRVDACHGVKIVADALVSDCRDAVSDLIALPGGMPGATNLKESEVLETIVKKQASAGRLYAAVCASPAVALGSWGLLKGLKATCYPSFMEQLAPACAATVESRVQQDGKVVTSRGPGTTMEFAIALVEQLYGKERADEVSGPLVMRANHGDEYTIAEFNPIQWTFDNSPQILVPIANGSEEMEAVMIIDILRRAKANVVVASVEDKPEILASRQIKLVADVLIDEAAKLSYDLIVLPGGLGGAQAFAKSEKLVNMLKKQKESNRPYGAICASPALVLEPHGLLKGKKATAFPVMCNKLSDQSEIENRVVVDGNLITSRGPGTSMEFALAIVEKFFGRNKALELAKIMLFTRT